MSAVALVAVVLVDTDDSLAFRCSPMTVMLFFFVLVVILETVVMIVEQDVSLGIIFWRESGVAASLGCERD